MYPYNTNFNTTILSMSIISVLNDAVFKPVLYVDYLHRPKSTYSLAPKLSLYHNSYFTYKGCHSHYFRKMVYIRTDVNSSLSCRCLCNSIKNVWKVYFPSHTHSDSIPVSRLFPPYLIDTNFITESQSWLSGKVNSLKETRQKIHNTKINLTWSTMKPDKCNRK